MKFIKICSLTSFEINECFTLWVHLCWEASSRSSGRLILEFYESQRFGFAFTITTTAVYAELDESIVDPYIILRFTLILFFPPRPKSVFRGTFRLTFRMPLATHPQFESVKSGEINGSLCSIRQPLVTSSLWSPNILSFNYSLNWYVSAYNLIITIRNEVSNFVLLEQTILNLNTFNYNMNLVDN